MAAKVYDGLFLGDAETSMDSDFLDLNKISRLVNVSGQQVQNVLSGHGFVYQTFCWDDQTDFLVFPAMEKDKALLEMVEFIDTSLRKGLSVLVFSFRGRSRNAFAICAFLMYKYNWGFEKSFDFILSKKSDLQINQGFVQQLFALEKRLSSKRQKLLRTNDELNEPEGPARERLRRKEWDPAYLASSSFSMTGGSHRAKNCRDKSRSQNTDEFSDNDGEDELLLVNSFLNGKNTITSLPGPYRNVYDIQKYFKLRFNSVLQEEDVHVFPTSPPSRYDPPKGHKSILKMKRVPSKPVNGGDHGETFTEGGKVVKALPQFPSTPSVDVSVIRPSTAIHRSHVDDSANIRQPVAVARSRGSSMDDSTPAQYRAAVGQDLEISNGRGSQQAPASSFKQPRDITTTSENIDIYSSAARDEPNSSSTIINGKVRSSQTAEDRLRHLMQDMRVSTQIDSAPKDEEKSNRNGSSRSYKDMDNYSSTGTNDRTYREYENASELSSERRNSGGGDNVSRPATADAKGKYSHRPNESLSLYDLAALPLHLDDHSSGRESKHRNSSSNSYGTPNGYSADDLRASVNARNSIGSNDRIALLRAEEMRELERDNGYLQLRESQQDRRREYDRDVDPLSMFQQQGQEGAVRVRYTTMPLPVNTSTPNKTVRNAWNDDYRDTRGNGEGGRASGDRDRPTLSTRGVSSNQSVDSRSSDRMSITSQPREREREKAALRTYRHGSPAPSRVSSSSRASTTSSTSRGFSFPSSSSSSSAPSGQRSRAASPSTPGSAVRAPSPGSGSMNRDNDVSRSSRAGSNNTYTQNPQRRSSFESGSGPLDESVYLAASDMSLNNSRGYSVSGFKGPTANSVANRFTRPPSPGTRKGVGTSSFSGGGTGYMGTTQSNSRSSTPISARSSNPATGRSSTPTNGRSSTPPRGNWRF